ncbi:MAG: CAMP factor family pore-forming toxin [Actinomycetaceae bacterium]|nr:CAMP factor family pore-forming toxin [Actinomycetaceae bacterium]
MKKTTFMPAVTALTLAFTLGIPGLASAAPAQPDKDPQAVATQTLEELEEIAPQVSNPQMRNDLQKLQREMQKLEGTSRFNPETIYDLDSIGARIELGAKAGEAITFATTVLADRVEAAHHKIGWAITIAVIKIANPFESVAGLNAYVAKLDALMAELQNAPKINDEDRATIYILHPLDAKLHEARFMGLYDLKAKSRATKDALAKAVHELTMERLRPGIKVKEVKDLTAKLAAAVATAQASA